MAARDSSQVAGIDSAMSRTAYGAAAPYSTADARAQNSVVSVEVPIGASSKVAVSSVLTASETRAMLAPSPGSTSGSVTRRAVAAGVQPSDRATSSSTGGARARGSPAR